MGDGGTGRWGDGGQPEQQRKGYRRATPERGKGISRFSHPLNEPCECRLTIDRPDQSFVLTVQLFDRIPDQGRKLHPWIDNHTARKTQAKLGSLRPRLQNRSACLQNEPDIFVFATLLQCWSTPSVTNVEFDPLMNISLQLESVLLIHLSQRIKAFRQGALTAGEHRGVAQRVRAGLRLAKLLNQIEKIGGIFGFKGDDKFLIVQAK